MARPLRPRPPAAPRRPDPRVDRDPTLDGDADLAVQDYEPVPEAPGTWRPPAWFTAAHGVTPAALAALRDAQARKGRPPAHRRRVLADVEGATSGLPRPADDPVTRRVDDLDDAPVISDGMDVDDVPLTKRDAARARRTADHPGRPRPTVARMS